MTVVVGLTGGIGSGKSTVARRLHDRGAAIVDADQVAREVVAPGTVVLDELADRFGPDIVDADGRLDRALLAARAFADESARSALDTITHPHIARRIEERIAALAGSAEAPEIVVVDHPLLVETGRAGWFDAVIVVVADDETRLDRLVARGMDRDDAQRRMAAQGTDEDRLAVASHVIHNDGDLAALDARVAEVHDRLRRLAKQRAPD